MKVQTFVNLLAQARSSSLLALKRNHLKFRILQTIHTGVVLHAMPPPPFEFNVDIEKMSWEQGWCIPSPKSERENLKNRDNQGNKINITELCCERDKADKRSTAYNLPFQNRPGGILVITTVDVFRVGGWGKIENVHWTFSVAS